MEVRAGYKQTVVGVIPEDWNEHTLGSITILMTNGFVGTATSQYASDGNGILYIQGYNVEENSFNFHGIKFVNDAFHNAHMKSCLRGGDLLTVQTGDVGLTTIVPDSLAGSNCHALIISRFDRERVHPLFVSYYLNSAPGRARLRLIETGTTMKHLNVGDMLQFFVPLPPTKAEQEAIAEALSDADAFIESLEGLIAKKRQIKQGVMQDLLTGKKRLAGFSGESETSAIGELEQRNLVSLSRGQVISKKDIAAIPGDFPIYSSSVHNSGLFGRYGRFMFDEEMITWSVDGGGHFFYRPKHKFSVTNVCGFMRVNSEYIDCQFLTAALQLLHSRMSFDYQSKAHPSVVRKEYIVQLPPLNEQTAIAKILSDMDTEITALETKLNKARQVKQGMMQELLTGRIRLV